MNSKVLSTVFIILSIIGISQLSGQEAGKTKILIVENGKVLVDTIFDAKYSSYEIDSIVDKFSGDNKSIREVDVRVITGENTNELDSLISMAKDNKQNKNIVLEIENGTSFDNKEKVSVKEIKIIKTDCKADGEKTIVVEQEVIKEQ